MRTICHSIAHFVTIVAIGLMQAGLFGGPALPTASAAELEPFDYRNEWVAQDPWGQQNFRNQHNPWRYEPWG
jgi:hypothetical protein